MDDGWEVGCGVLATFVFVVLMLLCLCLCLYGRDRGRTVSVPRCMIPICLYYVQHTLAGIGTVRPFPLPCPSSADGGNGDGECPKLLLHLLLGLELVARGVDGV
jgi:hypothetical protein